MASQVNLKETTVSNGSVLNASAEGYAEMEYLLPGYVTEILMTLYSITCAISLFGNMLIIFFVWKDRSSKRTANYFLVVLSVADIMFLIFCVPFTVLSNLINFQWVFGQYMCKLVGYIQAASVVQRSLMLLTSAAVQYRSFLRPFGAPLSHKSAVFICFIIWIISLVIPAPIALLSSVIKHGNGSDALKLCVEDWWNGTVRRVYSVTLMLVTYLLPFLVLLVTKIHISLMMSAKPPGEEDAKRWAIRRSRTRRVCFIRTKL